MSGLLAPITEAAVSVLSWPTVGWLVVGVLIGIFVGALPGVGAALGMAIVLPLTYPLASLHAIILLIGIYSGGMYGGSIPAILINVPGTGAAAATTLDGHPLARKGKAVTALALSATSSAFAGFLVVTSLFVLSPLLTKIVLAFGSPEYFLMAILGLSMITIITRGSMVKGFVAGGFGLLLTSIGIAPMTPEQRFTFGNFALYDGISYIAALIGLFAIAEMLVLAAQEGSIADTEEIEMSGSIVDGVKSAVGHPVTLVKSAFIGMGVGAIPGSGAVVSTFFAYSEALRSTDDESAFGEGSEEAVIASEAANNGTVGGSLIPTFAFGIPGSGSTAVLLGGLIVHGLVPGPALFNEKIQFTYGVFMALLLGNIIILGFGLTAISRLGVITKIDSDYIIPLIVVLAVVGGYTLNYNWFDVLFLLSLGLVGYFMKKYDYSVIAFVLGVILGPIVERNLYRSLQVSDGSWSIFVTKPLSLLLVLFIVVVLVGPLGRSMLRSVSD